MRVKASGTRSTATDNWCVWVAWKASVFFLVGGSGTPWKELPFTNGEWGETSVLPPKRMPELVRCTNLAIVGFTVSMGQFAIVYRRQTDWPNFITEEVVLVVHVWISSWRWRVTWMRSKSNGSCIKLSILCSKLKDCLKMFVRNWIKLGSSVF